ncbi:tripartite motif-containing protein 65 isoform X3 [Scophthalmus maximus]|uniref:tripartite motif-containing protein 65 isoform X3 n=1 Tax=Scophthalmus maximus TaxID=52904 RepID=UPI001FA87980|nr:tripartite motif-containing protein 65 isoform X3 [Scophthalmus maximus]
MFRKPLKCRLSVDTTISQCSLNVSLSGYWLAGRLRTEKPPRASAHFPHLSQQVAVNYFPHQHHLPPSCFRFLSPAAERQRKTDLITDLISVNVSAANRQAQAPPTMDPDHFTCSICLGLFTDPVTVPCGHSYCMSCLTRQWDSQPVCSCPQCRASFSPRPALGRNTLLVEMMQRLCVVGPPLHEDRGFAHATFDVSSVRPERTDGERLLGQTLRRLTELINDRELEHQQLKQTLSSFTRLAKAAVKDSSRIFSELLDFVERRRVEVKELIRAQEKAEVARAENHLRRLEREISDLRGREAELERLSHSRDGHLIPQMCRQCPDSAAAASGSLTVSPHVSFGPVRKAVSELTEQLQSLYHRESPSVASAVKTVNILQMKKAQGGAESGDSVVALTLDNRSDLLQYFCPLSLDPFTANRELSLTEGNRVVSRTGELHSYPDHPDRFDTWGQVLCREGLQGRSYWEAEWGGQQVVLGLTYESIGRKGSSNNCRLGHNSLSWSLSCSPSSFAVCHGNESQAVAIPVPAKSASRRVGVFLDHDAGLLCFYAVTPGGVCLLHRVESIFEGPLYPAAWLGISSTVSFCPAD